MMSTGCQDGLDKSLFGDFNVHHKDWLTSFGGIERPGELCYNISISNDLTQIVNFVTRIPDCDFQGLACFPFIGKF